MYSKIDVKSKIKDYSVNFASLNEIYKLIDEDYHLTVVDKNVANYFPKLNSGDVSGSNNRSHIIVPKVGFIKRSP